MLKLVPQPQPEAALGLVTWKAAPPRLSTKSTVEPRTRSSETGSTTRVTPSSIGGQIVGRDLVGEAEAVLEAGAAAAVDRQAQDRRLALPRRDRRDAGRGDGERAMSVIRHGCKIGPSAANRGVSSQ